MSKYYHRRLSYKSQFEIMVGKLFGKEVKEVNGVLFGNRAFKLNKTGKPFYVVVTWVTEST